MVESLLPLALELAEIVPLVELMSRQLILIFPAGDVMIPLNGAGTAPLPATILLVVAAITVVPSHSLQRNWSLVDELRPTVPNATHVPLVPCATLGPSK